MVNDAADGATVTAAEMAIANARNAIASAANVPAAEKAANTMTVDAIMSRLDAAKASRMAAMDEAERQAEAERQKAAAAMAALAALAAKLYAGIGAASGVIGTPTSGDLIAGYNTDDSSILVRIGDADPAEDDNITLSEDKKTMVAALHGWAGKRYADPVGGDMVEAMVYSNVEAPKQGKKFGGAAANDEFEYALTNGALGIDTSRAGVSARIALPGVTRTAGTETFKLPSPNPGGVTNILVSGSYHGVSGTYSCAPSTPTDGCTASVAAKGFTFAGGTWTFTPSDPNTRVTDSEDTAYASYGWWVHKTANDQTYTASAFVDEKGTVDAATGLNALNGTATYSGGAAGKYALSSSTGGTNDAGHFTARATLEADFTVNTDTNTDGIGITGTIDQFMGADGMSRDWSVKLNGSTIGDTGAIGDSTDGTEWTIGGTAAADDGSWSGTLRNNGSDGVPKVATGTFYSTYGNAGKMVGAFGANKE